MACEPYDRTTEPIAHLNILANAAGWTVKDIQQRGDTLHVFMTLQLPAEPAECRSTDDPRNLEYITTPTFFSPLKPTP